MPLAVVDHGREESVTAWVTTGRAVVSASFVALASARAQLDDASAPNAPSAKTRREWSAREVSGASDDAATAVMRDLIHPPGGEHRYHY
jgi:hypothetical protein